VKDAELTRARTDFLARKAFRLENEGARADTINEYVHYKGDPTYLEKDVARYERTTAAAVGEAAQSWLLPGERVVAAVRPTKDAPLCGRLAGKKP
jgi:zinc protease